MYTSNQDTEKRLNFHIEVFNTKKNSKWHKTSLEIHNSKQN